jgi:hypothetical protein
MMVRLHRLITSRRLTDIQAGLHFNPAGYDILFQETMKLIAERWPDQMPDELAMVLPRWNDADAWKAWEDSQARAT